MKDLALRCCQPQTSNVKRQLFNPSHTVECGRQTTDDKHLHRNAPDGTAHRSETGSRSRMNCTLHCTTTRNESSFCAPMFHVSVNERGGRIQNIIHSATYDLPGKKTWKNFFTAISSLHRVERTKPPCHQTNKMKGIPFPLTVRFILVASMLTGATESLKCVDKLYDVFLAESVVTNDRENRTYVLCPDSLYDISDSFSSEGEIGSAGSPLVFGRSNIHVICGNDGKSENNCTLRGGHVQAHLSDRFSTGDAINNVVLQGITFSKSVTHSVLAEHQGQMMILDCRFEVRSFLPDPRVNETL